MAETETKKNRTIAEMLGINLEPSKSIKGQKQNRKKLDGRTGIRAINKQNRIVCTVGKSN
jgi:hypothetical protein